MTLDEFYVYSYFREKYKIFIIVVQITSEIIVCQSKTKDVQYKT